MNICIVCFDRFTDIDTFLPWDLLNRVRLLDDGWSVKLIGDKAAHTSIAGLETPMHGSLAEAAAADAVLFTSGAKGIGPLLDDGAWLGAFDLDPGRQMIGSMCTGAAILAKLGLLDGLTATTYPTSVPLLESLGVTVVTEPIVVHGNIATAAGCLAAQDLSHWVIEGLAGKATADAVLASIRPVGEGCVALGKPIKAQGLTIAR